MQQTPIQIPEFKFHITICHYTTEEDNQTCKLKERTALLDKLGSSVHVSKYWLNWSLKSNILLADKIKFKKEKEKNI